MARARNIKPGFFTNEELAELDPLTRILFAGLWTIADRDGRLEDRPRRIKALTLPHDQADVDSMLNQLQPNFIRRYEVNGQRYIQVVNWHKHQTPHYKEVASTIPSMGQRQVNVDSTSDQHQVNQSASCPPDSLSLDSLNLDTDSLNLDICMETESQSSMPPKEDESPVVIEFPCDGKPAKWSLRKSQIDEWSGYFPSIDVQAECRKALAWILASPERRKTFRGMNKFLVGWIGRSQDRGSGTKQKRVGKDYTPTYLDE